MNQPKDANPTLIARETLRQLASLKIPPTPDNYHKLYNQIAGNPATEVAISWGNTIEILLKQLESRQGALTVVKKREGVNRVLARFSKDSNQLHNKLKALIDSWGTWVATPQEHGEPVEGASPEVSQAEPDTQNPQSEQDRLTGHFTGQLLELLAQILEHIAAHPVGDTTLIEEAGALARQVRTIKDKPEMEYFATCFQQFCCKFDAYGENGIKLQQGLLRLLNRLIDSADELMSEDQLVRNQFNKLRETISRPLDLRVIAQAEQYLEEIMQRQEIIRRNLGDAKVTLKQIVVSLITNIEELTDSTGEYQEK
ncbi:MAG: GGDEF domain-containing protein, partial [Pseudomonadota bacterium]